MKNLLLSLIVFSLILPAYPQKKKRTENIILITLDGMRWQDVFTGADIKLINNKDFTGDSVSLKKKFWSADLNARRKLLFPFLWSVIGEKGQLYGNRLKNSYVNVTNQMWFSYPGYNEILTGSADDQRINSNDKKDNPNETVLEQINRIPLYKNKVAAFTSWEVFPEIINTKRSGVLVNSGTALFQAKKLTDTQRLLNELVNELPFMGETRPDAITFHLGFDYLKENSPSVLFVSFDETDHFAHERKYDLYLQSAHYTDKFIETLWNWLQSSPKYKDKTTLIVTTDHGRGVTNADSWRHHGKKEPHADEIWSACIGPDTPPSGEMVNTSQFYQSQIAATICYLLNIPASEKMAAPIKEVFTIDKK